MSEVVALIVEQLGLKWMRLSTMSEKQWVLMHASAELRKILRSIYMKQLTLRKRVMLMIYM